MGKKLSEMTLQELWQLFPIFLTPPDKRWEQDYEEMAAHLTEQLAAYHVVRLSHIGSTAIGTIWAKPIVDILAEIGADEDMCDIARQIEASGFTQMAALENRISFCRGYTESGFAEKVYHLHLRYAGDNDELYFRDYLRDHPAIAKEYERLKIELWHEFEHDRDAYTGAKTDFIRKYTQCAKKYYGARYQ